MDKSTHTKTKILNTALKVFSENGYHAASTRIIASKAGVNEVTLFRIFKNKLGLFREVLNLVSEISHNLSTGIDKELGPEESIRFVMESLLTAFEGHPREYRILVHALLDEVEGFEEDFVIRHHEPIHSLLTKAFGKLKKENKISSKERPEILARLLLTQLFGVLHARIIMQNFPLKKIKREDLIDSILNVFLV